MATSEYQVSIDASGLGGAAPADGFIDPSTVEQYRNNLLATGSSFGTVSAGQVVMINNYPVTMSGSTISTVVSDINAQSAQHHAVASNNGGDLALQNEPLYTAIPVSVCDGTPGITVQLGFDSPTLTPVAQPSTLDESLAKKRANLRWNMVMARLSQTMTINSVHAVLVDGETLFSSDPTSIEFNVVFDNDAVYAYDPSSTLLYGIAAVQSAVAQALMDSDILTVDLFDPTETIPTPPPNIAAGMSAQSVTVGALTNDYPTAVSAVTVTFIA
jgi:hypothetical protein